MKTDYQKFIQLFTEIGIPFFTDVNLDDGFLEIVIRVTDNPKLCGYSGHFNEIFFEPDGKFFSYGFWEDLPLDTADVSW